MLRDVLEGNLLLAVGIGIYTQQALFNFNGIATPQLPSRHRLLPSGYEEAEEAGEIYASHTCTLCGESMHIPAR